MRGVWYMWCVCVSNNYGVMDIVVLVVCVGVVCMMSGSCCVAVCNNDESGRSDGGSSVRGEWCIVCMVCGMCGLLMFVIMMGVKVMVEVVV